MGIPSSEEDGGKRRRKGKATDGPDWGREPFSLHRGACSLLVPGMNVPFLTGKSDPDISTFNGDIKHKINKSPIRLSAYFSSVT